MKKNRPMLHNPGCHGPLKWCTVCETQTKMDKATDPSIPLIQFSPLRQCTVSTLAMRLTLKFFSLMVKSCSVHPSPIIAILRQWTLLRHLIRQIVICIVHFLWLSVIQHLKDSIQTILLSHRRQKKKGKKKDSLPEKVTMTLPIIGESTRWGFPAYDGCTLLSVFLFGCVGFFHLYKNIHSSSLLWIESSEIPFWFCSNRLPSRKHFEISTHQTISSLIPALQSSPFISAHTPPA